MRKLFSCCKIANFHNRNFTILFNNSAKGGCATEIIEAGEELRPEVPLTEVTSGLVFEENLTTATEGGSEVVLENIATPYLDDVLQKNPECIDEQEIYNIVNEGKGSPGIVQVKITSSNIL